MNSPESISASFQMTAKQWIGSVGTGVEIFGVAVIIAGITRATYLYLRSPEIERRYDVLRIGIGRSLLLGIEVLLAADIIKTIVFDLAYSTLGVLAGLVLIRTFLSWSLVVEIEGRWPWQRRTKQSDRDAITHRADDALREAE